MVDADLFSQINNAVLDLQRSSYTGYARPLKALGRLLENKELAPYNLILTEDVNLEAFLASSERTQQGMTGSAHLDWPEEKEKELGLGLLLIVKLAADPEYAIGFSHTFFYTDSSKLIAFIHEMTSQFIIPFIRDYKSYVASHGSSVRPRLVLPTSNKVFIVHGHDEAALQSLARFLEKIGLEAIVLKEQPDRGRTIIEKFEDSASEVGFAVVLLTPDDIGGIATGMDQGARARQNVLFELGYFAGNLGRGRVCLLRKGQVEIPSDLFGIIYTDMDPTEGWKTRLVGELKAAGLTFDPSRLWQ